MYCYKPKKNKHKDTIILLGAIATAFILAFIIVSFEDHTIYIDNGEIEETPEFNPCDLKEVVCEDETEWITAEASAYTSRVEECDDSPCISANGMNICEYNGCIVANNSLKLNSYVEVEGFGKCLVADRMNRRYGKNNMDIYFGKDLKKALKFGRRNIKYKIL